jgi:hypothetical protein
LRRAVSAQARSQTKQALANGLAAQFHLLEPLDLLNHILSSQLSRPWFGLPLCMAFTAAFNVAFVVSIFIAQHYLQFPFLKWRRSNFTSKLPISVLSQRPSQMNAPSPGTKNQDRYFRNQMSRSFQR